MVQRKRCINTSNFMYSGRERSPLGYGYHQEPVPIGTILKGKDGNNYIATYSESNVKIWEILYIITDSDSDTSDYDEDLYKEKYNTKINNQKIDNNKFMIEYNRLNYIKNNNKKNITIKRKKRRKSNSSNIDKYDY